MSACVADTHTTIWFLTNKPLLSAPALAALESAEKAGDQIHIPAITLVEITYLVEKGRIPRIAWQRLVRALRDGSRAISLAPLDLAVAAALQKIPRGDVPDMPDRIIAATALSLKLPLVTRDGRIRASGIETIWQAASPCWQEAEGRTGAHCLPFPADWLPPTAPAATRPAR